MAAATLTRPARRCRGGRRRCITRKIPSSGEELPIIGLGTSGPFEVDASEAKRAPLREVLTAFFAAGGASHRYLAHVLERRRQCSGIC